VLKIIWHATHTTRKKITKTHISKVEAIVYPHCQNFGGDMSRRNAIGEWRLTRQHLAHPHRRVIRIHLWRTPLPSHTGLKGIASSRGRVAPHRARKAHMTDSPKASIKQDHPIKRNSRTTSLTASLTTHQDISFSLRSPREDMAGRLATSPPWKARPQVADSCKLAQVCHRRGDPYPPRIWSRA
jgi:hypothetical protein